MQALERMQGGPARAPGHAATRTHDYRHHSTLALLAALDLDTGQEVHLHFHFHFTPTYASWLNPVEYWFSALQRHVLAHSSFAGAGLSSVVTCGAATAKPDPRNGTRPPMPSCTDRTDLKNLRSGARNFRHEHQGIRSPPVQDQVVACSAWC